MAKIKFFGELRTLTGQNEDELDASSLSELLQAIGKKYGAAAKKSARSALIVADGEKVLAIRKVQLQKDSEVGFFPLCCGG